MTSARPRWKKVLIAVALSLAGLFLVAQVVPYGRAHTNPPVTAEPTWDTPATRALARTACFDCHSNETQWPWYSHLAPTSWLVQYDVDEGRSALNFSEGSGEADEASEAVREGEMPPRIYLVTHPEARLSAADRERLARGLDATFGGSAEGDDDDD